MSLQQNINHVHKYQGTTTLKYSCDLIITVDLTCSQLRCDQGLNDLSSEGLHVIMYRYDNMKSYLYFTTKMIRRLIDWGGKNGDFVNAKNFESKLQRFESSSYMGHYYCCYQLFVVFERNVTFAACVGVQCEPQYVF